MSSFGTWSEGAVELESQYGNEGLESRERRGSKEINKKIHVFISIKGCLLFAKLN